jgi:hypothetical protein
MQTRFDCLLEKIRSAPFTEGPFRHIAIEGFLSGADFEEIVTAPEVNVPAVATDDALFDALYRRGYKIIDFPGCITDQDTYVRWHAEKGPTGGLNNSACEGFGVTLRLMAPSSPILKELTAFLASEGFNRALADRFGVPLEETWVDNGLQKYLDGYEISPHPDIRRKALTYMVNINPYPGSEGQEHHTQYLTFKPQYRYVQHYWEGNEGVDRCWVPRDWCDVEEEQHSNNSIVIFQPGSDTMHGVKAAYDHLKGQRTQLYGNLWYADPPTTLTNGWEDLVIGARPHQSGSGGARGWVARHLPAGVRSALRTVRRRSGQVGQRSHH